MEVIGDFEYNKKDLIGHGAFAVVFKGRHRKKHDFTVAIKSITKKNLTKTQSLLSKEIKILQELSSLHHENVVALLDCKETSHHVYLVMEYCNGGDLADYLQAKGTLSEDTIAAFLKQIAGAMKALNAKDIVHRDMKPQNILLCHDGKPNPTPADMKLKIADFGFARFLNDGVMAATLCGSPMYMAPEVIMSLKYDAKADLWSVGTIVYQCLTGKAPFQAQTPQQLKQFYEKNSNLQPNIPSGTSPHLRDLLCSLLKRNAKDRIAFDDFFNHPFLNPRCTKSSSPVPVPRTRSRSSVSDSPTMKAVSDSPLSGKMPQSPPNPVIQRVKDTAATVEAGSSPPQEQGFLKLQKEDVPQRCHSPTEGFVLVPEHIPSEHSIGSSPHRPPSSVDLHAIFSDAPESPRHTPKIARSSAKKIPEEPQQQSPSRPSSLPVQSPGASSSSQPIPVPSQVKAFEQMRRSSSYNSLKNTPSPSTREPNQESGMPIPRKPSAGSIQSLGSMSPPNVQFSIGTPPSAGWKRNSSGTPPPLKFTPPTSSPHRKTGSTPPQRNATPTFTGPASLPTIMGSPTKVPAFMQFPSPVDNANTFSPTSPLYTPFGQRTRTCPDNIAAVGYEDKNMVPMAVDSDPRYMRRNSSGAKLSEHLLRAAFGTNQGITGFGGQSPLSNIVVPYGGSGAALNRDPSQNSLASDAYKRRSSSFSDRGRPHSGMEIDTPPDGGMTFAQSPSFAQSPPTMEGPILFEAPELLEETLMDKEHNETVSKLSFVLSLVECIIDLAKTRSSPISESVTQTGSDTFTLDHLSFVSDGQRCLEQLVLYVRALQLLSSSIDLAKEENKNGRLQASNTVKIILKEMKSYYHQCLKMCRHLHNKGLVQAEDLHSQEASTTADKLIYGYAIELCQSAALDEIFRKFPNESFQKYRNAQILLHSLAQKADDMKDKNLINKYKEAVERRLHKIAQAFDNS